MRYSFLLTLIITSIASSQTIKQSDIEKALKDQYDEIDHYLDQRIADAANDRRELHKYDFSSLEAYESSIENLRPNQQLDQSAQEWLLYNILELRFLQGKRIRDIADKLAMSESDLYRKQRIAVEEVARQLALMEEAEPH